MDMTQELKEMRYSLRAMSKCLKCNGTGKLAKQPTMFGFWIRTCQTCYGKGKK